LAITCDALEATEATDFSDPRMPERPTAVTISASNGEQSVKVELGRGRGRLVIEEPDTLTEGDRVRIEKLCAGRFIDRTIAGRAVNIFVGIALAVVTILLLLGAAIRDARWLGGIAGILYLGAIPIGFFAFRNQSEVLVINRYRGPSFLKRTRDEWIVEVVVMLMGLLLGFIIGHLTK
jgi:hypothetical protein